MTKKDYIVIAKTLAATRPEYRYTEALGAWRLIVHNMAMSLKTDNPRFDYDRFMAACGAK